MKLKIKKLREDAVMPRYATDGAAGMDLCAALDEPVTIAPGQRVRIPTGIAIALPSKETVAVLCARSGLAHRCGLTLSNCVGIIDSDYRGEILVSLINQSGEPCTVSPGERFCQMLILPVLQPEIEQADTLDDTERGAGGFGSTGLS